jgi:hypothetical protein
LLLPKLAAAVVAVAVVAVSCGKRRGTESHPARRRGRTISMLSASIFLPRINHAPLDAPNVPVNELLSSRDTKNSNLSTTKNFYFQLQFGCELLPEDVNGF